MPLTFTYDNRDYILGTQEEAQPGYATIGTIAVVMPNMDVRIRLYVRTRSLRNILDFTPPQRNEFEKQLRRFAENNIPVKGAGAKRLCYGRKLREKLHRINTRFKAEHEVATLEALA